MINRNIDDNLVSIVVDFDFIKIFADFILQWRYPVLLLQAA